MIHTTIFITIKRVYLPLHLSSLSVTGAEVEAIVIVEALAKVPQIALE